MAAGPKFFTEAIVQSHWKQGRGQGEQPFFKPWMYVQEFSGRGMQSRLPSFSLNPVAQVVHHVFSYIERGFCLYAHFRFRPKSYRTQVAMEREITMGAAKLFGVRYPRYTKTGVPIVMTLDAVMRADDYANGAQVAFDCKPEKELKNRRVLEKLSLHKAYCAHVGMPHVVITEKTIPRNLIKNLDWLRSALPKPNELTIVPGLFTVYTHSMLDDLYHRRPQQAARDYCKSFDQAHHLPRGTGLRVFKFLLWTRDLLVDLTVEKLEMHPMPFPSVAPQMIPFGGQHE